MEMRRDLMYGMVNKALRAFAVEAGGDDLWARIREAAGVKHDQFVSMQAYPDGVTYALATAAAEILGQPLGDLLEAFGRFWIPFVKEQGYGELLIMLGDDLPGLLANLDAMHTSLSLTFPEFRPPSFHLETEAAGRYLLHYHSERPGLAPFVTGLVQGLGAELGTRVSTSMHATREEGAEHDVLRVEIEDADA
jgi:hypothetical protein